MPKTTITIPTGFEAQQRQIERRRKIAEALMGQGMAADNGMTSWTQALGKLAQTWVGKRIDKRSDQSQVDLDTKISDSYNQQRGDLVQDSQTMGPEELVNKYGNNPLLADALKPYQEALIAKLKDRQQLTNFGGRMVEKGSVAGQFENNPNASVLVDQNGSMRINPVKVAASVASQGLPLSDASGKSLYQTEMPYPGLVSTMMGQAASPAAGGQELPPLRPVSEAEGGAILQNAAATKAISAQDAARVAASFGPQGQAAMIQWARKEGIRVKVATPQEASQLPSGTPLMLPDGTEGVVP